MWENHSAVFGRFMPNLVLQETFAFITRLKFRTSPATHDKTPGSHAQKEYWLIRQVVYFLDLSMVHGVATYSVAFRT